MRPLSVPKDYSFSDESDLFCIRFSLKPELLDLSGHFPGNPLVPGFLQLSWLQFLYHQVLKQPEISAPFSVKNVKFKEAIVPPGQVRVSIRRAAQARFTISLDERLKTSGTISLPGVL